LKIRNARCNRKTITTSGYEILRHLRQKGRCDVIVVCEERVPPLEAAEFSSIPRDRRKPERIGLQIAYLSADLMAHVQNAQTVQDRDFNKEQ